MRSYLVILIVISALSCKPAAAQTRNGRVISIDRSATDSVTLMLEITSSDSDDLSLIRVETPTMPTDIQLNSRVQVDIDSRNAGESGANTPTEPVYQVSALRLDNSRFNGSDKTGVRARMKQAGTSGQSRQRSSHRGRH